MKYKGNPDYKHDTPACTGVLITNLGTPDAPTPTAVRKYLGEFLSDPRVIETPKIIWWVVLHCIILRIRPRRSAEAYKKVWTENGSPLLDITIKQVNKIQTELSKRMNGPVKVELAMRYGNPSIEAGLEKLRAANAKRILIFPLYPQYSAATTASTFDAVSDVLKRWRWIPEIRMINHYHDNPDYITALANSIKKYWQTHTKSEKLIFSFHGLPRDYFLAGDPYHCECHKTARLVAEELELQLDEWQLTFQSRFGPREWLQPYTDITLKELATNGIKHVQIVCPGFSADCLETIEEIDMQNRQFFIASGGEEFSYIPALNDSDEHIDVLSSIIQLHFKGWDTKIESSNCSSERAKKLGSTQ
ncbi:MAG: ferrochelatase [Legionellales bacterium]|nr:ferrochelatase [Legionellales bacterium]